MDGYYEDEYTRSLQKSNSTDAVFYAKDGKSNVSSLQVQIEGRGGHTQRLSSWRRCDVKIKKIYIVIAAMFVLCITSILLSIILPQRRCTETKTSQNNLKSAPVISGNKGLYKILANVTSIPQNTTTAIKATSASEEFTTMLPWPDAAKSLISTGWYPVRHDGKVYLYKISVNQTEYNLGTTTCGNMGGKVASVGMRIPEVRSKLFAGMVFRYYENIYIGLDDLSSRHTWKWMDGVYSTRDNTDWSPDEPNSAKERCGEILKSRNFKINDVFCSRSLHFLCEIVM